MNEESWLSGPEFYQDVDGFYYYDPKPNGGTFSSYALRKIADRLDELNDKWNKQIEQVFKGSP